MNIEEKFQLLIEEVEKASKTARAYFESTDFSNEQKSDGSVVTKIDKEIEVVIRSFITKHFPEDSIIGEEDNDVVGTSSFVWHLDPIDGTDNFLRKIPFCAISIARLGDTAEDSFAIVHNPITDLTFASLMDEGTYENEHLTNLTAEPLGGRFLTCIGAVNTEPWMVSAKQQLMIGCADKFGKGRSYGSTALELAYVSAGRIDAFLTYGLHSWDYAAGLYLVRAAGGTISVFENDEWREWTDSIKELCKEHGKIILVSHPDVHAEVRDFIGNPKDWATAVEKS